MPANERTKRHTQAHGSEAVINQCSYHRGEHLKKRFVTGIVLRFFHHKTSCGNHVRQAFRIVILFLIAHQFKKFDDGSPAELGGVCTRIGNEAQRVRCAGAQAICIGLLVEVQLSPDF